MSINIKPSFSNGELAPDIYGRVDIAAYQVGLRKARNTIIHTTGGISNRAGTKFLAPVKDHTDATTRLIPFSFKATDSYILEFGNLYIRVIRNDGHVVETGINISAITQANPAVVTTSTHSYTTGDEVYISGIVGMTQLNGNRFTITVLTSTTFSLQHQVSGVNIDSTGYTAWSSAGTTARIYTVVTPYVSADLANLKYAQSADTMTITHPTYAPRDLTRVDHDSWTLTSVNFVPAQTHPTGVTIAVNGANNSATWKYKVTAINKDTGEESLPGANTVTLTISAATQANPVVITTGVNTLDDGDEVYISGIVGMTELNDRRFFINQLSTTTFELLDEDGTGYTAWSSGGTAIPMQVETNAGTTAADNTITWTIVPNILRYAVYRYDNGIYGLVGETEIPSFKDGPSVIIPDTSQTPPRQKNPFRIAGEFPATNTYYKQRQVYGGSNNEPDTAYYSKTGYRTNMSSSSPIQDDDGFNATLAATQVNNIRWFVPQKDLIVFTSGSEWNINDGAADLFSATTINQDLQSQWGCSHRRPIIVGTTIMYVDSSNDVVRSLGYSFSLDKYTGSDMTILAPHLFKNSSIVDWAYGEHPETRIFCVREDGQICTFTFEKDQEVIAWTTWDTLGTFQSVATLRHQTDGSNVYFIIKRNINGNVVRYIEKLSSRIFVDIRDAFFVDSGLSLDVPIAISDVSAASPVVVTTTAAHGLSDGDEVDLSDIIWESNFDLLFNETQPSQLNNNRYIIANKTATTFELTNIKDASNIDGSGFNEYVSGGNARLAVLTVSGLDHLEGRDVVALADGNVISSLSVANGAITFLRKFSRIHVGLRYISDVETLDIESTEGTIQSVNKKIPSVTIRFKDSRGLFVGPNSDELVEMKQREYETLGTPTSLLTGDKKVFIKPSWNTNGRLFLRQPYPLPMTILAIIPDVIIGDDYE